MYKVGDGSTVRTHIAAIPPRVLDRLNAGVTHARRAALVTHNAMGEAFLIAWNGMHTHDTVIEGILRYSCECGSDERQKCRDGLHMGAVVVTPVEDDDRTRRLHAV